jgi:hypothetical protein
MFDLVDLFLLRRGIPADDRTLAFRRIDGDQTSNVIYFLPWHTPFAFAWHAGFVPLNFLACYEMPSAIVSSEPELCAQAMLGLVADAGRLLVDRGVVEDALIVGLSVGSYPATYLANRIGARLCSVASADRGDLAIWESPATHIIKRRAVHKGYQLSHYSQALFGTHPAENLSNIAADSLFVMAIATRMFRRVAKRAFCERSKRLRQVRRSSGSTRDTLRHWRRAVAISVGCSASRAARPGSCACQVFRSLS